MAYLHASELSVVVIVVIFVVDIVVGIVVVIVIIVVDVVSSGPMFLFPVVDVITVDIVVLVVSVVVVSRLDAMVGVVLPVNIIVSGTATAMTRIAKMAHPIKSQHA